MPFFFRLGLDSFRVCLIYQMHVGPGSVQVYFHVQMKQTLETQNSYTTWCSSGIDRATREMVELIYVYTFNSLAKYVGTP